MSDFMQTLRVVIFTIFTIAFLHFFAGLVIMLLWNQLMPQIFGLPLISLWQAIGLRILSTMLVVTVIRQPVSTKY